MGCVVSIKYLVFEDKYLIIHTQIFNYEGKLFKSFFVISK